MGIIDGGHVACRLARRIGSGSVLLQSEAAYIRKTEQLPLDVRFIEEIRRDKSWEDSKAFVDLERYDGKVMGLDGEDDLLVPRGVQKQYRAIALHKGNLWSWGDEAGFIET